MPRTRTLAMVAAIAIGATMLSSSTYACDERANPACQRATLPSSLAPDSAAFERRPTTLMPAGRRAANPGHDDPSPNVTALSVTMPADKETGISSQQFQRIVSKQSIASAIAGEMRSPWLEPALFSVTTTYPVGGGILAASNDEFATLSQAHVSDAINNLKQPTANELALDDHNDLGDENRRTFGERRIAAPVTRASDNGPFSVSWIELAFLVWGGLLTVGSGLRLIFG